MKTRACNSCFLFYMQTVEVIKGGQDEVELFRCPGCGKETYIMILDLTEFRRLFFTAINNLEYSISMTATYRRYWCRGCKKLHRLQLPVVAEDQKCPKCQASFTPPYTASDFGVLTGEEALHKWLEIHRARNYGFSIK
jgi:Zn finger protein HypA/HybF involved in hydrogenase expression